MGLKYCKHLTFILILLLFASLVHGDEVDLKIKSELKLSGTALDMAFSRDGQWLYVLQDNGELWIYTYQGKIKGKVKVGKGFEKIEPGPVQDEIYLLDRRKNRIQIVEALPTMGIDISTSPVKGAANAKVVIVEYTDFQCPYCAKLAETFSKLLKMYPGKIKVVYKSFPLNNHKYAWKAAANAMAAHQKGKFWEFHDLLFANSKTLNEAKIMEIRQQLGLGDPTFDDMIKSPAVRRKVAEDVNEGRRNGVKGTPTVFVNGKRLKDKSLKGFRKAIDAELKE